MGWRRFALASAALVMAASTALARAQEGSYHRLPQHEASQNRTWSLWITLDTCGDVNIDRIDQYRIDAPPPAEVQTSPNQQKILQWSVQNVMERGLSLGDLLVEMSRERYAFRVWVRVGDETIVRKLYISPYGASNRQMPALSPEAAHDVTLLYRWFGLHDFTPRSRWNPERNAFDHEFPRLLRHFGARMEMKITFRGPGCQEPLSTDGQRSSLAGVHE